MRITEAAQVLGTSARMLRYRESLGLLPLRRQPRSGRRAAADRAGRAAAARAAAARAAEGRAARAAGAGAAAGRVAGAQVAGARVAGARVAGARVADGLAAVAGSGAAASRTGGHRQFSETDLAAAALGLSIERRYDISPAALAFGIRVLADERVRSEVAELGRRIGRIQPPPARALDFEQERAQRLLRISQQ